MRVPSPAGVEAGAAVRVEEGEALPTGSGRSEADAVADGLGRIPHAARTGVRPRPSRRARREAAGAGSAGTSAAVATVFVVFSMAQA
jgi:hypothetical protein